ncbi:MAG: carboxylating nicotinate-nucleotide diphosphorylase [Alphaproteobacteria bacterium]|nr:carboxylating nicotinate-nucleotide diphosphorylase [Alphaproteobacteria bacterium]
MTKYIRNPFSIGDSGTIDRPAYHKVAPQLIKQTIAIALKEDLGRVGDITSRAIIPETAIAQGSIRAREAGVLAGIDLAIASFEMCAIDKKIELTPHKQDGNSLKAGDNILDIVGPARPMLAAERVALNYISHLSAIASLTRLYVEAVKGTKARICCTRKTTPHLRIFEKYAVRQGGGINHRFGLDDGILIKDNHIAVAGSVTKSVAAALANMPSRNGYDKNKLGDMRVEVEVERLEQVEEAIMAGAHIILLDNMPLATLRKAVALIDGRAEIEASGGVELKNVRAIAETGVDYISVGRLTHSVPNLDFGLDFDLSA